MPFQLCFKRQNAKPNVGHRHASIPMKILACPWPKYGITHKPEHIHILGYFVTHENSNLDATQTVHLFLYLLC